MTTTRSTRTSLPTAGTYRWDPTASQLAFTTRHLFGLAAVRGTFALTGGRVVVPESGSEGVTVEVSVDTASVDTASAARDRAVRSAGFLDAENHPEISFTAAGLVASGSGWRAPGQLTVRGTTAPVELTVTALVEDSTGVTVRAHARIDRYAHGLTRMKGLSARHLDLDVAARADRA